MDVADLALALPWQLGTWLVALPIAVRAVVTAPWRRLGANGPAHVFYASIFALTVIWCVRGEAGEGFAFHLLGSAAFALLVGSRLALAGGALVVALTTAIRSAPLANAAAVWLVEVAVPVAIALGILRLCERWAPPNFFVYVFGACFFGAWIAYLGAGLCAALLLIFGAGGRAETVLGEYFPYLLYLGFGEATLTGMTLTLATVYRPAWVATFDAGRYFAGR